MSYLKACALGIVGTLAFAAARPAFAVTLADLKANGTPIVLGDKVYSNFDYISPVLPASDIGVNFVQGSNGAPDAIQFGAGWNTAFPASGNLDTVILYTISTTSGGTIAGVGLDMAGVINLGGAVATVGETITNPSTGETKNLSVFSDGTGGQADVFSSSVNLDTPASSLNIKKDINVSTAAGSGFASVTFVDNTYTPGPNQGSTPPIPEPMSLALLPLALVGLGLRKKLARA